MRPDSNNQRRAALVALLITTPVPALATFIAMVALPGASWSRAWFLGAKVWIFLIPLLWCTVWRGRSWPSTLRPPGWSAKGMPLALTVGLGIALVIVGSYLLLKPLVPEGPLADRMSEQGLAEPASFALAALYWITINSLLEEYFWRWFVLSRLRSLVSTSAAVLLSSLLFTVHHVIALSTYFAPLPTALASAGVFAGGLTFAWLYVRSANIYAAYVCHVLADLAVFGLGWKMLFAVS